MWTDATKHEFILCTNLHHYVVSSASFLIHLLQLHDSKNEVESSLQRFLDVEVTELSAHDDDESDMTVNTCWYLQYMHVSPLLLVYRRGANIHSYCFAYHKVNIRFTFGLNTTQ